MGLPMALALEAAGFDLAGFDRRPSAEFGGFSKRMLTTPADVARARVVFSVVRDREETEALLFSEQAILCQVERPELLVICSTLDPGYVRDLALRLPPGVALVDAPMSGAPVAAEERRLSFMLGGEAAAIDRLQPMLAAMGTRFHRLGPLGAGMTTKVLNNFVAASSTVAVRRVLDWGDRLGVAETDLLAVMADSSGQTWFGSAFDEIEFARDGFAAGNTIGILKKDVESLLAALPEEARAGLAEEIIAALEELQPRPG